MWYITHHPTSWRSTVIWPSHLCLGLPRGILPQVSHHNPVCTNPVCRTCYMLRQSHSSWFHHQNVLLSTLFLNTLILWFSVHFRHQVSHPHKTTGKIRFTWILIFIIFDNWKIKYPTMNDGKLSLASICTEFLYKWNFDCIVIIIITVTQQGS
jgi:uncharacterized membrane protein